MTVKTGKFKQHDNSNPTIGLRKAFKRFKAEKKNHWRALHGNQMKINQIFSWKKPIPASGSPCSPLFVHICQSITRHVLKTRISPFDFARSFFSEENDMAAQTFA